MQRIIETATSAYPAASRVCADHSTQTLSVLFHDALGLRYAQSL